MSFLGDMQGDLVEMELHRLGVGEGQCKSRADAPGWTDRAEQVGTLVALIGRLDWPRAAPRPLPDDTIFLADPGFVLEPDLDPLAPRYGADMGFERAGEIFLKASMVRLSCIGCRGLALMWEKPSALSSLPMLRS